MNRHRSDIKAFNDLVDKHQNAHGLGYGKRWVAYELAEAEWISTHGQRRFKTYRNWYRSIHARRRRVEPNKRDRKVETLHFIQIFFDVSNPIRKAPENYEMAEAKYIEYYGARRFKNFNSFMCSRTRLNRQKKQHK